MTAAAITLRRCWFVVAFLLTAVMYSGVQAMDFGSGPLPIAFEPAAPFALDRTGRIDISGSIDGSAPTTVVLRIDDGTSTDYASRMNIERRLDPGPFAMSFDVATLRASDGRKLDTGDIRRVILFILGAGTGHASHFALAPGTASTPSRSGDDLVGGTSAPPSTPPMRSLGQGRLPLKFDRPLPTVDGDEIVVEGIVHDAGPAAIALRIDDAASTDYASRFNDERRVPPGPFRFAVGVRGLKTANGRTLDAGALRRVLLFAWDGKPNVTITRFALSRGPALPVGARGYSFGAVDAAVPPGFERIGPADGRIVGRGVVMAVRRPAPDPLIANGLSGVRRISPPAPSGRVRVTVWSEDPGEWELLPHPLERRIQVNGRDLVNEKMTADAWIAHRYLRGAHVEHGAADDAWTAYGAHRGNAASIDVETSRDGVVIELSGGDTSASFVNAVLVEPVAAGQSASLPTEGQSFVTAMRARWYRETLPVAPPLPHDDASVRVGLDFKASAPAQPTPLEARIAPDTGASLLFDLLSDTDIAHPQFIIQPPRRGGVTLGARLWAAQTTLERDGSVLRLGDGRLVADTAALGLIAGAARGYELWIDVPASAPPGHYTGSLSVFGGGGKRSIPVEIAVVGVALPKAAKPAGFYLARAAHLDAFAGLTLEREKQVGCDLDLLRGFGLTNTAPPIGGLDQSDLTLFASDMRRAQAAGVAAGWLIYNPLDALVAGQGMARAAQAVGRAEAVIHAQGLPEPTWSVADEPSNADQANGRLEEWVRLLRAAAPGIHLAGHLNSPKDEAFAGLFDTLIVNAGFGIDAARLARIKSKNRNLWLYNSWAPRQTAGVWLWRTAADRYVQWHARMPTADPFDPTDGREADFQAITPTAEVCPRQPDIHRDLLRMAEGVVDQRWLAWLDAQSTPQAQRLRSSLLAMLPDAFAAARALSRRQLEEMRGRIIDIAVR